MNKHYEDITNWNSGTPTINLSPEDWNTLSGESQKLFMIGIIGDIKNLKNEVEVLKCELNAHRNTLYAHKI